MAEFIKLGSLNKKKNGGFTIKVDKDAEIVINGKKFTGDYINVQKPTVKYDNMLKKGKITEDEYNKAVARFAEGGDLAFVRQELTIVID